MPRQSDCMFDVDDLVDSWDSPVKHYDQVQEAVEVLREALASSEDKSVVISSVGFLTNIANLLSSPGDIISESTGYELVRDKVGDHNLMQSDQELCDAYQASHTVLRNCTLLVLWS